MHVFIKKKKTEHKQQIQQRLRATNTTGSSTSR